MKRSKLIIGIFIALLLVVLTIVLLAFTVFIVRDVKVESDVISRLIDEEKIVESSGLVKGTNIISINKTGIKSNIEKENPYVEIKSIVREFPSTVVITATVRTGIMLIPSDDGDSAAVIDSSMKILNVVPAVDMEKSGVTLVKGVAFKVPEEGALTAVGTVADFTNESFGSILREVAEAAKNQSLDISGASFSTFFKEISFVAGAGVTAIVKTNRGVSFVLDSTLATSIYEQLYMCIKFYTSKEVEIDRTRGYITLNKDVSGVAYQWVESLD